MSNPLTILSLLSLIVLAGVNIQTKQDPPKDIKGGAALIFKRPENPTTKDRKNATEENRRTPKDDIKDKVEDAIALGNAARDRKPPDFESAEKAYRLAWKLDPRDPRPYIGLGNVYWDQRRYPEAAQAYREAVRSIDRYRNLSALLLSGAFGISKARKPDLSPDAQTRVYYAATLLEQQDLLAAERQLRLAARRDEENAEWNGLFGYVLSAQGRYTESLAAYQKAIRVEPSNEKYRLLLTEATQRARETSVNDQAITTRMQNTTWSIRNSTDSINKGACELDESGSVRCKGRNSSLTLLKGTWRIRDGIFTFEGVFNVPFCIGKLHTVTIDVLCYKHDSDVTEVWTKVQK